MIRNFFVLGKFLFHAHHVIFVFDVGKSLFRKRGYHRNVSLLRKLIDVCI
jgi:hypothetical protein